MMKTPPPIDLWPIHVGEIDGRRVDFTADLGSVGDQIPSVGVVSVAISRRDGFPMTGNDLALAGPAWPITLDPTQLMLTIGLAPPPGAAGISYLLTVMINKTVQARLFIRDLAINVAPVMG